MLDLLAESEMAAGVGAGVGAGVVAMSRVAEALWRKRNGGGSHAERLAALEAQMVDLKTTVRTGFDRVFSSIESLSRKEN